MTGKSSAFFQSVGVFCFKDKNMKIKKVASEVLGYSDKELWIEHFISTESRDRGGDIMMADGMKFTGVPVVLWQHGQDNIQGYKPIAKPIEFRTGKNSKGVKGVIAKTQYPDDEEGQKLYKRTKNGFMPNWSIGYDGSGEPLAGGGFLYKEWELLEYSNVAVPMNADATHGEIPTVKDLHFKGSFIKADPEPVAETPVEPVEPVAPESPVVPDIAVSAPAEATPIIEGEIVAETKTIADDCAGPIAWNAMMIVMDKFLYSLHGCGGKKPARKLCEEMSTAIGTHAETYADWAMSQQQEGMISKAKWVSCKIKEIQDGEIVDTVAIPELIPAETPQADPVVSADVPAPPETPTEPVIETPPEPVKTAEPVKVRTFADLMPKASTLNLREVAALVSETVKKNNETLISTFRKSIGRLD